MIFLNKQEKRVLFIPDDFVEIIEYFNSNKDACLVINFYELRQYENFNSFDFLKEVKIKHLRISGSKKKDYDLNGLLKIKALKSLDNTSVDLPYDFNDFKSLERIRLTWNKSCVNFSSLNFLLELSLLEYKPKSRNLLEFQNLRQLEEIRLIQSNINSISGIEFFSKLKIVSFISNRSLTLDGFDYVFESVEELYIESCKKINYNQAIKLFPNIRKLTYINNADLESLRPFLDSFKKLDSLNVAGTMILEKDNRYWEDYDNIEDFNFSNRKHQLLKVEDLYEY